MNDTPIGPTSTVVNNGPPTAETPSELEADRYYLPGMIRLALDRLESAATAALRAVRAVGAAKAAADEVKDRAAACELDAIGDAIADAAYSLEDAQGDLESIHEERAPEDDGPVDAGDIGGNGEDDEDDKVAGYLAVGPSTSDRIIDGFIAVGADRVLSALDRLTSPTKA